MRWAGEAALGSAAVSGSVSAFVRGAIGSSLVLSQSIEEVSKFLNAS